MAVGLGSSCVVREQHHQLHHAFAIEKYPWLKWNPFNFMNIKDTVPTLLHQTDMQNAIIDPGLNYWEMTIGLFVIQLIDLLFDKLVVQQTRCGIKLIYRGKVLEKSCSLFLFVFFLVK